MNTDKLYITIKHTIEFLFKSCLLKPCLIAICALFIIALIRMIFKAKPIFKSKKQALSVFILFFYLAVVFEITLFMRLSNRIDDPFSNIYGSWTITQNICNFFFDICNKVCKNFKQADNIFISFCFLIISFYRSNADNRTFRYFSNLRYCLQHAWRNNWWVYFNIDKK